MRRGVHERVDRAESIALAASPDVRAGDADREHTVGLLRVAHADGRLTLDEFDERAATAFAARTYGELRLVTTDLPEPPRPAPSSVPAPGRVNAAAVRPWLVASVLNVVIWAVVSVAVGAAVYPWFVWVAGPWGVVLLVRRLAEVRGAGQPARG